MGMWDDFKSAIGIDQGERSGKADPVKPQVGADVQALASEYGLSTDEAASLVAQAGSASAARRHYLEINSTADELRVTQKMQTLGIDRSSAQELIAESNRLESTGPDAVVRSHGEFLADPARGLPDNVLKRREAIEHLAWQGMQPRKTPINYANLPASENAEIAENAKRAAMAMSGQSNEALQRAFHGVPESDLTPPTDTRLRRQWITHMSSQQQYAERTGKEPPAGLRVLARAAPTDVVVLPEKDRRRMEDVVKHVSGLDDKALRTRFQPLPNSESIDLPGSGPARTMRVRSLLNEELGLRLRAPQAPSGADAGRMAVARTSLRNRFVQAIPDAVQDGAQAGSNLGRKTTGIAHAVLVKMVEVAMEQDALGKEKER